MQNYNIVASLSQGNILSKKQSTILYIGILSCLFIPIITVVLLAIPQVIWDISMALTMTLANFMFISFLCVLVYVKIKNDNTKKKISIWLKDAVKLPAYSMLIGENRLGFQPKAAKIQVQFNFQNKKHYKESTAKVYGGQQGYLGTFSKFVNKNILILYSPKYDEVLIINE